jgi:hypothetical protein
MAKRVSSRRSTAKKKAAKKKPDVTVKVKGNTLNIYVSKTGLKKGIRAAIHDSDKP